MTAMNISATNLFREIHQDHVKLRQRKEYDNLKSKEPLADTAKELLKKIRSAGRNITDLSQRQRLESYGLYWSRFISEVTDEYRDFSLFEPEESLLQSEEVEEKLAKHQDWGDAPDVSVFFGRTGELAELEKWIVEDRCRVVAIFGMAGIGKTFLARKLAEEIKNEFDYIIWRSLLNAPPVTEILTDIIKLLSSQEDTYLPDNLGDQIGRLLRYLKEQRCLLILDNVETILQSDTSAGQYREGYEGYGQLFKIGGETDHQSCLLLTGREKPQNIERLKGKTKPVRFLELGGLDHSEAIKIFIETETEISFFPVSDDKLRDLIKSYNGNPLALELAARHIKDVFSGDISEFLKRKKPIFGDLRELLSWSFNRLSDPEKEIMYWFAINREPVSLEQLKDDILSFPHQEEIPSTIQSLQRRLPLQKSGAGFTLQPVLMEYMTERLIEQVCEEIERGKLEIFNSHALIKATAKDYVREAQIRLILKPVADRLLGTLGSERSIEAQLTEILSTMRERSPLQLGYVAGNILNLLIQLKTKNNKKPVLSGYDFSKLNIWQAYLQDKKLHHVNFANSHIDKSIFTQTFGKIFSVSFRPDGKLFATGDSKGEIRLWQVEDGQQIKSLKGHTDWVRSVAFSPDGQTLASGSEDKTIRLWDVETGQSLKKIEDNNWIWSVAFSPDGQTLAIGSEDKTIRLWDVKSGKFLKKFLGHNDRIWSVAFSPDGQTLASGSEDESVMLWDVKTEKCQQTISLKNYENTNPKWVHSVAFSPDGQTLAIGSEDNLVRLWDVVLKQWQKNSKALKHENRLWSVTFSSNSKLLASGSNDGEIKLWDISTGQCLNTLQGHSNWIRSLAFSPDGQTLASGSDDQTIKLWDVQNVRKAECRKTLQGYVNSVWSVAFNRDGQTLASGSNDSIVIWNPSIDKEYKKTFEGHNERIRSVSFSPNGQTLASGSEDFTVRIWQVSNGECLHILKRHTNKVWSVAFHPDGNILASSGNDRTIRIWDASNGTYQKILGEHTDMIRSVAFSPDGQTLASGSDDHTIKLWDVNTGQCLNTFKEHSDRVWSVAFSPDGQTLASGSDDQTIKLWDVNTGQCLNTLQGHLNRVRSVIFNPNCNASDPHQFTLASSDEDGEIKLWNDKTGNCLETLTNPRPYEEMIITGVQGLSKVQKDVLKELGAVE